MTTVMVAQGVLPSPLLVGPPWPTQTSSRANSPLTVPVPKPMVTWSQSSSGGTGFPSELMAMADGDFEML